MRTTVNIDEHLLRAAQQLAAAHDRRLGDVVDDALRLLLADRGTPKNPSVSLPSYGGSGLQPGVDLEDKACLATILGDDEPANAAR